MKTKRYFILFLFFLFCGYTTTVYAGVDIFRLGRVQNLWFKQQHREVIKIVEPLVERNEDVSTFELCVLAQVYYELRDYKKALTTTDLVDKSIAQGDKSLMAIDFSAYPAIIRGYIHLDHGDYIQALKDASEAFRTLHQDGRSAILQYQTFQVAEILGIAYAHLKKDREVDKILGYLQKLETKGLITAPHKHIAMAKIHMARGQFAEALADIQNPEAKLTGLVSMAVTIQGIAQEWTDIPKVFIATKCFYETGKIEEAKNRYDQLLQHPQIKEIGELYWLILLDRAKIARGEGQIALAEKYLGEAVDVIEKQRSSINTETGKIGFVGDKQAVYHNLVSILIADKQYDKAFEYVERSKARALIDLLASKREFSVKTGDEREIKTLLASSNAAEAEILVQDASLDKSKTRSVSIKMKEELQRKSPELASLVTVTSHSASEIQNLILAEETLIEYYYRDKDMYAFILSKDGLRVVKLYSESLLEDIQAFRKLLETPESTQYVELSKKLYERLFQPLEGALNKRDLIIVPHGVLHYLPINALYDGKSYLIDRYNIRMMPSASALRYLQDKQFKKTGGILAFGNPDLGNPNLDLVFAQKEAVEVANTRSNSKVFVRKEATEAVLRKYGNSYNYIHFATHGLFNSEAPLKSALLLAPDSESDGMLTVDKLYSLKLDADLVTLSACETGLSKIANGDDLVGLTRGFLYAGCNSIVASLWKVDDLATATLMVDFYSDLNRMTKQQALRTAQLNTKKKYAHPYYWASFQLTGSAK